jgi:hypothetical protein
MRLGGLLGFGPDYFPAWDEQSLGDARNSQRENLGKVEPAALYAARQKRIMLAASGFRSPVSKCAIEV